MCVCVSLSFFNFVQFQVVQEYERAVIFRLGRLMQGGAKGPGKCHKHNLIAFLFCFYPFVLRDSCNFPLSPVFFALIKFCFLPEKKYIRFLSVFFYLCSFLFRKTKGIFFILPCIDSYARVDLRTRTYDVPPQEVRLK